ncbi:MAG: hypothetical protein HYW52_11645, partial [Gemmatimonadetes bacterium]|nr:hypothetical protein [Gemmatimonadota bacterium]
RGRGKVVAPYDFGEGDPDPSPGLADAHGTACAGVATAAGGDGVGVTGIAPRCRLMPIRLSLEGLDEAADDFPNPPVPAAELRAQLEAFNTANTGAIAADTAAQGQHAVKDDALADLAHSLRVDLKYGEFAARDEPEKLKRLGWSPRREGTPLEPPGEVRDIGSGGEGDTWVILRWKPPVDGGVPGGLQDPAEAGGEPLGGHRDLHRYRGAVQQSASRGRALVPGVRGEQGGHRAAERHGHGGVVTVGCGA